MGWSHASGGARHSLPWILNRPRTSPSLILIYISDGRRREAERRLGHSEIWRYRSTPLLSRSITEIDIPDARHLNISHLGLVSIKWTPQSPADAPIRVYFQLLCGVFHKFDYTTRIKLKKFINRKSPSHPKVVYAILSPSILSEEKWAPIG